MLRSFVVFIFLSGITLAYSGGQGVSSYKLGQAYIITSLLDNGVITVQSDRTVTTEEPNSQNNSTQIWTIEKHPHKPDMLEFKQAVQPYNGLSGYKPMASNPTLYPRPLGLVSLGEYKGSIAWNIRINFRWCLQSFGKGSKLEGDDCEDGFSAPYQLFRLDEA